MTTKRKLVGLTAVIAIALIALAWHGAIVTTAGPRCNPHTYNQEGFVRFTNDETQDATVRASNTTDIPVGTIIHRDDDGVSARVIRAGDFHGDVSVTISVNYPSDHTLRPTTGTLHFSGVNCQPPPTTTTSVTSPPHTNPPTTPTTWHPRTTTTTVPSTTVTVPPPTIGCDTDTVAVCTPAKFAG